MTNPFSWLGNLLSKLWKWAVASIPIVQQVFNAAIPIIQEIIALVPKDANGNRVLADVIAAYQKYAVPVESWILALPPDGLGVALMNLVTAILRMKFATIGTDVLQAGIQNALVEVNAAKAMGGKL